MPEPKLDILSDLYMDEEEPPAFHSEAVEINGKEYMKVTSRVARLDVINKNRRLLKADVMQRDTVRIVVSDWGHDSVPRSTFFGGTPRKKPVGIADLTQSGSFLMADTLYPTGRPESLDSYDYVKTYRDIIGYSVTYRPMKYSYKRNKDGVYVEIEKAEFAEVTPDVNNFVASPGTRVMKIDSIEQLTEMGLDKEEIMKLFSDDELMTALQSRGKKYGDMTPLIEYVAKL